MGIDQKEDVMVTYRAMTEADLEWACHDARTWRPKRTRRARRRWRGKRKALREAISRSVRERWAGLWASRKVPISFGEARGLLPYQANVMKALAEEGETVLRFGYGAAPASPETIQAVGALARAALDQASDDRRSKGLKVAGATLSVGGKVLAESLDVKLPTLMDDPEMRSASMLVAGADVGSEGVTMVPRVEDQISRYLRDLASRPGVTCVADEVVPMLPITLSDRGRAYVDTMLADAMAPPSPVLKVAADAAENDELMLRRRILLHTSRKHRGRRHGGT